MVLAHSLLLVLTIATLAGLSYAGPAMADRACSGTVTAYNSGPNIIASSIVVVRVGCRPAKQLLKTYFQRVLATAQTNGGCAHQRGTGGCVINGWRCTVTYRSSDRQLLGRCARGPVGEKRVIRFDERDIGPS